MSKSILKQAGALLAATAVGGVLFFGTSQAWAQQKGQSLKQQLVGTWTLVSNYGEYKDGKRINVFGEKPKGLFMVDRNGRFSFHLFDSTNRQKFASNSRMAGTAEENKAAVLAIQTYYGTYSVDEKEHSLTFRIEYSVFPNWDGTERKISIAIKGDEMQYVAAPVPSPNGPFVPHIVWKRVK